MAYIDTSVCPCRWQRSAYQQVVNSKSDHFVDFASVDNYYSFADSFHGSFDSFDDVLTSFDNHSTALEHGSEDDSVHQPQLSKGNSDIKSNVQEASRLNDGRDAGMWYDAPAASGESLRRLRIRQRSDGLIFDLIKPRI